MRPMRRRQGGTGAAVTARAVLVGLAFGLIVAASGAAAAQTSPPPATATPPAAVVPVPPPPPPSLEAGDTAPPGAAKVDTVDPLHAPPLTPAQAAEMSATPPLVGPAPAAPRHTPFYRKEWFWGAVALVAVTSIVVATLTLGAGDPSTPSTKLKDMRAF
jgi:hypothetical protein